MTSKRFFSIILFVSLVGICVFWVHYNVVDIHQIVPPLNVMKKSVNDVLTEIGVETKLVGWTEARSPTLMFSSV